MFQLIILLLVLAFLAGFIAFLGDRLGSYIGKKRLSLFGWRPKQTGRFIGILAGILIMFSTLGIVSLIDRDLTRTIIQADAIRDQNQQLRAEQTLLQKEIERSQIQVAEAQQNFTLASTERDTALAQRDTLVDEGKILDEELTALKIQSIQADTQLSLILANLSAAETDLDIANTEKELALVLLNSAELLRDSAELQRDSAFNAADEAQTKLQLARDELAASRLELTGLEEELANAQSSLEAAKIGVNAAYIEAVRYSQEVTKLKRQVNDYLLTNEQISFRADLIRSQADALQTQKELLEQEKAALETSNEELQLTLDDLFMRELVLQSEVTELQQRLDSSTEEAQASRAQLEEISQRAFSYAKDEIIYNALIDATTTEDAFAQLSNLVKDAKQVANSRGVTALNVSSEKVDSVIEDVLKTSEPDVVTLLAPDYIVVGETVNAEVSIDENSIVAEAGKLIATRQLIVEEDSSIETLTDELSMLAKDANKRLQNLGMLSKLSPMQQDVSSFVETLAEHQGSVVVGLVTTEAIYKASASGLELLILR